MPKPQSTALPIAWITLRILIILNWFFGACILALLLYTFVNAPWTMKALGVSGYRSDARKENDATWHSHCRVHSIDAAGAKGNLVFPPPPDPPVFAKTFTGELTVFGCNGDDETKHLGVICLTRSPGCECCLAASPDAGQRCDRGSGVVQGRRDRTA